MYKLIMYIVILLMLPLSHAYGSGITDAMSLALSSSDLTREERITIAQGFNNECKALLKSVPLLSPKENQWLDNEINNGRVMSVSKTPEYGKRVLYNLFSTCDSGTTYVSSSKNAADEALGWSILLSVLVEFDTDYYMKNSGVDALIAKSGEIKAAFRLSTIPVVKNILIPLLRK